MLGETLRDPRPEDGLDELRKQVEELRSTNRTLLISGLGAAALALVARATDGIAVGWQIGATSAVLLGAVTASLGAFRWRQRRLDPADEARRYMVRMVLLRKRLSWAAATAYLAAIAAVLLGHLCVL